MKTSHGMSDMSAKIFPTSPNEEGMDIKIAAVNPVIPTHFETSFASKNETL
mgnify:CR=1 FL=1